MREQRRMTGARRGFTLLELMLVVTMMAILASMSLGKMSTILEGWRMTRASQAYAEELQQAFALVGRNRKPVIIEFNTDSMTLFLRDRSGTIYRRRYFGNMSEYQLGASNLTFSMPPLATNSHAYDLEVYPPGLAADSMNVTIRRPSGARRIRMLRGGLVQICAAGSTC